MAMFPDSGVPPADAKNSLPDVDTLGCDELWYSTSRCQPRFDPAAANAMLAEQMNLIMRGEIQYDCIRLDHIERAVRYINQRGLPRGCLFTGGPLAYLTTLDPKATRYNDYMTLTIIPNVNNQAAVTLDLDGLGVRTILRNDGLPLQSADLKANRPAIISYWQGSWYVVGLVASQVPLIATGMLDTWIRTDGNDDTGDGTENSAAKAFRTINGALKKVGGRFAVSANFSIALRLGITGTYEAGDLSGSPNRIYLIGDASNPAGYRIAGEPRANNSAACIWAYRSNEIHLHGVTLLIDMAGRVHNAISASTSVIFMFNCNFQQVVSNPSATLWTAGGGAMYMQGNINVIGNGGQMRAGFVNVANSYFGDSGSGIYYNLSITNMAFVGAFVEVYDLSIGKLGPNQTSFSGITGMQYIATANSILYGYGKTFPGTIPGTVSTGAQFIA